ncbi:hypothetical protein BH23BAC1_BH23BAC1_22340 [soil metagenome]
MILLIGACGTLGKKIGKRLLDNNQLLRGMTRKPNLFKELQYGELKTIKSSRN